MNYHNDITILSNAKIVQDIKGRKLQLRDLIMYKKIEIMSNSLAVNFSNFLKNSKF